MRLPFRFCLSGVTLLLLLTASSLLGQSAAVDAQGKRHTWRIDAPKSTTWEADIVKRVSPDYPYEARKFRQEGAGLYRLQIDPATGKVTKVTVLKSTGVVLLDNKAIWALSRWQLKPGRWREADVPIVFTLSPFVADPRRKVSR